MGILSVKVKKMDDKAVLPAYAKQGDAGMDLTAISKSYDDHGNVVYGTGLAFEIPEGYVGLLFPRSSNSKKDLILSNSVGVIDSGYRGEVALKFKPSARYDFNRSKQIGIRNPVTLDQVEASGILEATCCEYKIGDRIGQIIIMPYPQVKFTEVNELSDSERGVGGFGSSGT